MQAASLTLTILLAGALGGLWWRSVGWGVVDEHADRLSELEQQARNAKASIEALTYCVEELQDRMFEHEQDHAPARKAAAKRAPAKPTIPTVAAPVKPAVKNAPAKKAAPKKAPTKKSPVSTR